jgi:hypothetical protein
MPPVKIGKFNASLQIIKQSWAVLKQNKEIMWIPIISSISSLVIMVAIVVLFFIFAFGGSIEGIRTFDNSLTNNIIIYGVLFVYYLLTFLIVNYFQAVLFIIVQAHFSGKDLTLKQGFEEAKVSFNKILIWSLISATVGIVLGIIADKFKIAGRIIASLLGAAWNIMTYFSLPSLVIGKTSVKDSFKESASMIRKTWGETIIVNFGVGYCFGILAFVLIALAVGIAFIIPTLTVGICVAVLLLICLIILSIISSTLGSIFKLVIYNYAKTGQVPQGFSSDIVKGALK